MSVFSLFPVLQGAGPVALAERGLMLHAVEFMLIVAVPVITLLFLFAWRYRASNTKAVYAPNWEHSKLEELIWWAIPFEIVLILGALTWGSTHELAPQRPLDDTAPLVVQVVALEYKWLFIYPEQGIATVNYLALPVGRPVRFDITGDAPMNSFWIPQLGGQIYAMTGMVNTLNLEADQPGQYHGMSANYSGEGFVHMQFVADAMLPAGFDSWVESAKAATSSHLLDQAAYARLAAPIESPVEYLVVKIDPFESIVSKYMDMSGTAQTHDHH